MVLATVGVRLHLGHRLGEVVDLLEGIPNLLRVGADLVEGAQKQASADVPSFASIARRSDFTPEKIAYFLLDPHPKMPNFPLSRTEAADLAAYIGSLRQ